MDVLWFLPRYIGIVFTSWFGIVGAFLTAVDVWRAGGGRTPSIMKPRLLRALAVALIFVASAQAYKRLQDDSSQRIAEAKGKVLSVMSPVVAENPDHAEQLKELKRLQGIEDKWKQAAEELKNKEIETSRLRDQLDTRQQRKADRLKVTNLLTEGHTIKLAADSSDEQPHLQQDALQWEEKTFQILETIDVSYAARFKGAEGPTYIRSIGDKALPKINNNVWNFINIRTDALSRILETMPD